MQGFSWRFSITGFAWSDCDSLSSDLWGAVDGVQSTQAMGFWVKEDDYRQVETTQTNTTIIQTNDDPCCLHF